MRRSCTTTYRFSRLRLIDGPLTAMAEEMGSWRSLASSASRSIKGYVAQRDWKRGPIPGGEPRANQPADGVPKPSLRQWAGQTLRAIAQPNAASVNVEKLALFPGWAHRRYHEQLIQTIDGMSNSASRNQYTK